MNMNDNYWKCIGLVPPPSLFKKDKEQREEAYRRAHEIRQFEIQLFWTRGTYYWAFILAAFTAHFTLLSPLLTGDPPLLSLSQVYNLPRFSLFALTVTAFLCYFFSLCWVLMNKGSKFWQENWEE